MMQRKLAPLGVVIGVVVFGVIAVFASIDGMRGLGEVVPEGAEAAPAAVEVAIDTPAESGAVLASVSMAQGDHTVAVGSVLVTQTFELDAGWNAIYLEVEPINGSPLVEAGAQEGRAPDEEPILVNELSTMEWVFQPISDVLESAWTWHTRGTTMDFIVHPGEGLWDAPGWVKYFPEGSIGPDGESREFLTDLVSMHAHRGYLVHIDEGVQGPIYLDVVGLPEIGRPPRGPNEYNLFGFPLNPSSEPDLATFVEPLPIDEVYGLLVDGTWDKLWGRDLPGDGYTAGAVDLGYGEAYLIKVPDEGEQASDMTRNALLDIRGYVKDGLEFGSGDTRRGAGGVNLQTVAVKNWTPVSATLTLRLITGTPSVSLYYDVNENLSTVASSQVEIGPGATEVLEFQVPPAEQPEDGNAILEIASADLGTRWLMPVEAHSGSVLGLWMGDVTIVEVSEGRLGSTNIKPEPPVGTATPTLPMLTFGLRPRNDSQIRGAVTLAERATTGAVSLDVAIELDFPDSPEQVPAESVLATEPVIFGNLFEDRLANGEKDLMELGFRGEGITVTLTGPTAISVPTSTDGSWIVDGEDGLTTGTWQITHTTPAAFFGFTNEFTVTLPVTSTESITGVLAAPPMERANRWPVEVEINADLEVESVTFQDAGGTFVIERADFLIDSVTRDPVPPPLDFGYVQVHEATLRSGSCSDPDSVDLGLEAVRVVNGFLVLTDTLGVYDLSLNEDIDGAESVLASDHVIYVEELGGAGEPEKAVACGELTVGKPTMVDGRGSQFDFRVLLRVEEQLVPTSTLAAEILPYYETNKDDEEAPRVTAPAFALTNAIARGGVVDFGAVGEELIFDIQIDHRHSINPFKHKYHPDHDNLDAKFNPIDLNAPLPQPYQREVYQYRRKIILELQDSIGDLPEIKAELAADLPPEAERSAEQDAELDRRIEELDRRYDWKGKTWGGLYTEVIKGVHKHDITVKGHFIIRHVLQGGLVEQRYD